MEKVETGVLGLDEVLGGGIPKGFLVLVAGPPGAGKTTLTSQVAFHHAERGGHALMLSTLSSPNTKLLTHLAEFSYFSPELIGRELQILNVQQLLAKHGVQAAIGEIRHTVMEQGVGLLVLDSVGGLSPLLPNADAVQRFVLDLGSAMYLVGCTTLVVDDRYVRGGEIAVQHNLSDGLISLEVSAVGRRDVRQLRAIKLRASSTMPGAHSLAITNSGVRVYPRVESLTPVPSASVSGERQSWGVPGLDALTGGGVPIHDSTLLLGPAGMGKTTMGLQFLAEGVSQKQACTYVTFHETQQELLYKAAKAGMDLQQAVDSGLLSTMYTPSPEADVDQVIYDILADVEARGVGRLVVDTINVLERDAAREERFTDVLAALVRQLRQRRVAALMIRVTAQLTGVEAEVATSRESYWMPMDNILVVRPVQTAGSLSRIISVLKMRYSAHDSRIHSLGFGERGVAIGSVREEPQAPATNPLLGPS